jgi:hypothetical protein
MMSQSEASDGIEIDPVHLARVKAVLYPRQNFWRVGRKVGRTIYAQIGSEPSDDDPLIGVMDTLGLAEEAVDAHNARLTLRGRSERSRAHRRTCR